MRSSRALAPALLVALSACSGGGAAGGSSGVGTSETTPSVKSEGVDCQDPSLDQSAWMQYCSGQAEGDVPNEGEVPPPATLAAGKPLEVENGGSWTVTRADCGRTTVRDGTATTNATGDTVGADATSMPGFVFCSVEGTFTNKGSAPIDQIPFLGNLETADQKSFSPYEDNVSIAAALFGEDRLIPVSVANV